MAAKTRRARTTKRRTAARPPSAGALAAFLGVTISKPLKADRIQRLRRALPGYVGQLDDAASQLEEDRVLLGLRDVTPAALLEVQARQKHLAAREAVADTVRRAVYQQRLQADDEGMGMLQKLARRIEAVAEDDPDLKVRWKFLLKFLAEFRAGGRPAAPAEPPAGPP